MRITRSIIFIVSIVVVQGQNIDPQICCCKDESNNACSQQLTQDVCVGTMFSEYCEVEICNWIEFVQRCPYTFQCYENQGQNRQWSGDNLDVCKECNQDNQNQCVYNKKQTTSGLLGGIIDLVGEVIAPITGDKSVETNNKAPNKQIQSPIFPLNDIMIINSYTLHPQPNIL